MHSAILFLEFLTVLGGQNSHFAPPLFPVLSEHASYKIGVQTAIAIVDKFLLMLSKIIVHLISKYPQRRMELKSQLMIGTNCQVLLESIME